MGGVGRHRLYEVRDLVVASTELHVYLGPGVFGQIAEAHQAVVNEHDAAQSSAAATGLTARASGLPDEPATLMDPESRMIVRYDNAAVSDVLE